jgi:hypothetical protein
MIRAASFYLQLLPKNFISRIIQQNPSGVKLTKILPVDSVLLNRVYGDTRDEAHNDNLGEGGCKEDKCFANFLYLRIIFGYFVKEEQIRNINFFLNDYLGG